MALSSQPSLVSSIIALLTACSVADARAVLPRQISTSQLLSSYDYIIVGGGTAGLTVADRLTEDPAVNVLVLEAGNFGNATTILTASFLDRSFAVLDPMSWPGLYSVPQTNLNNASYLVWIAKAVGGGSAINGMYNVRGSVEDYDRWAQLFETGSSNGTAIEWGWDDLLPYFKKATHFVPPTPELTDGFDSIKYDASYWGNTSDIYSGWPNFYWPGVTPMIDAWREIDGVEFPVDSGAGKAGVFWFPSLMDPRTHTRSYAQTGHYQNVNTTRSNYHLLIDTLVRRVLIDDELVATGVEFPLADGTYTTITADKEVILSAGAIHTPHLLQLSGIGPKALLEAGGIETLLDLPGVGQNFQDHSSLTSLNITLEGIKDIHPNQGDLVAGSDYNNWAKEAFAANQSGPYSIPFANLAAWLPLTVVTDKVEALATTLEQQDYASILPADAHATVVAGYKAQMQALAIQLRSKDTIWTRIQAQSASGPQGPVLLQPLSRGTVEINTTDPWNTEPLVDFRALSNPLENDIYIELIKFIRRYSFETSLGANYAPVEYAPGANVTSDADLKAFIASTLSASDYHPVGTASMLPLELGGVVDQTLRVYGVKNLRVVDGSVIPMLPGANTCQPVYAIAEKAADLIKSGI